ncbi:hypothetical protein AAWM_03434 [Aspergillus awamori]|uniref:Uncharacterized protein n=1 Tax=Aspergillus awamori TaxID=105351 RepID=A0A401KMR1_ASPAW|nr:hypothetical protein AAWM_03434 [Aspergillus awamori]
MPHRAEGGMPHCLKLRGAFGSKCPGQEPTKRWQLFIAEPISTDDEVLNRRVIPKVCAPSQMENTNICFNTWRVTAITIEMLNIAAAYQNVEILAGDAETLKIGTRGWTLV